MAALLLSIFEQMLPLVVSLIVLFANLTSQFEILKFCSLPLNKMKTTV